MPRKSKKKAEAGETLGRMPGEAELTAASEAKIEGPADAESSVASDEAHAEAKAAAADTFEQAFEDRVPTEHAVPVPAEIIVSLVSEAGGEQLAESPDPTEEGEPDQDEVPVEERPPARLERLQKILSQAGVASRRHAEEMIVQGRVQVNGQVVTGLGSKADPDRDHIRVDGKLLRGAERPRYFVLNKPKGFVTTVSDPEGRPTVMQFFKKMRERLYPVGRLDYQSEGLLLVTNDGELANKLTRPASGVERTYLVKVSGRPAPDALSRLRAGLAIDRGRRGEGRVQTSPAEIREVRQGDNPWFEVVLTEGRNRELRKMFEEIGHHVEKIRRVGYGPLVLDVEPGRFRELEPEEVARLRLASEGKWRKPKPKPKEHEGRRKDFARRPDVQRRPAQQKFAPRSEDRNREGRGEGRRDARAGGNRRATGRNAPSRPSRPAQGGFQRRPERAFGDQGERAPRGDWRKRQESGAERQRRPERPFSDRGERVERAPRGDWRKRQEAGGERQRRPERAASDQGERAPRKDWRPRQEGGGERQRRPERAVSDQGERAPRKDWRPRQEGGGERQRRPERRQFESGRDAGRGSQRGTGRRPEGRKPEGGSGKFRPAAGRGRPGPGGGARPSQHPSKGGASSGAGQNRQRGPRGKRG